MKKIYFLIAIMLFALSINSKAQLNYLFSATSRPYVPVTGGITPHLISDYAPWEVEDEGLARIPIGFTFNYNNKSYTEANVSVNGFITLGDFFSTLLNFRYFQNDLARGPYSYPSERPVIAPLWDDLLLADTLDLVYKTTGHAPFRVFTIEWKKAKWVYESVTPVLSIELKLYETSNIIEFHYKDEGSLPDPRFAFASIGITSTDANRNFISLQSSSSQPQISMLRAIDSISVKPADNQVYRFTPSFVKIPPPIETSITYTNNKVSFKLQSGGFNSYEYALTHSPIPPSRGIPTFSPNVTVSSLLPATTYYIYARSDLFGWINSQWVCDSFTTAVARFHYLLKKILRMYLQQHLSRMKCGCRLLKTPVIILARLISITLTLELSPCLKESAILCFIFKLIVTMQICGPLPEALLLRKIKPTCLNSVMDLFLNTTPLIRQVLK